MTTLCGGDLEAMLAALDLRRPITWCGGAAEAAGDALHRSAITRGAPIVLATRPPGVPIRAARVSNESADLASATACAACVDHALTSHIPRRAVRPGN